MDAGALSDGYSHPNTSPPETSRLKMRKPEQGSRSGSLWKLALESATRQLLPAHQSDANEGATDQGHGLWFRRSGCGRCRKRAGIRDVAGRAAGLCEGEREGPDVVGVKPKIVVKRAEISHVEKIRIAKDEAHLRTGRGREREPLGVLLCEAE